MLKVNLIEKKSIVILEPDGALSESDFEIATKIIDPFIEKSGKLNGIIIHAEAFPGWDSFSALLTHLKFVNEHHKKVSKVAFVTNSVIGEFAQHIASHFVNAKVKNFSFSELEDAINWIDAEEVKKDVIQKELSSRKDEIRKSLELLFKANMKFTDWDVPEANDQEAAEILIDILYEKLKEIEEDVKNGEYKYY